MELRECGSTASRSMQMERQLADIQICFSGEEIEILINRENQSSEIQKAANRLTAPTGAPGGKRTAGTRGR